MLVMLLIISMTHKIDTVKCCLNEIAFSSRQVTPKRWVKVMKQYIYLKNNIFKSRHTKQFLTSKKRKHSIG